MPCDAQCQRFADPLPLASGDAPPLVNAVKLYDTAADKIIVELETVWDSKARLLLGVSFTESGSLYAPVEVTGIRFQGVIRVIMAPMLLGPPFVGSMSFASALAPNIDFRIKVLGGEVSAIPGLREALQVRMCCVAAAALHRAHSFRLQEYATSLLNATFTWPNRIVVRARRRCMPRFADARLPCAQLPFRRARNPADMYTVLSPAQVEDMRRCEYEELSETRVRSWGSRGLTRRINKQYGTPGRPPVSQRKGVTSRVVDVVRGVFRRGKRGEDAAAAPGAVQPAAPAAAPAVPPPAPPPAPPPDAAAGRDAPADAARWERALAERRAARTLLWSPKARRSAAEPKRVGWLKRAWRKVAGRRTDA